MPDRSTLRAKTTEPHGCDGRDVCSADRHPYVAIDRLGFNGLMAIAKRLLDEHYPADLPIVCHRDSPDPGARLTAALRDCIDHLQLDRRALAGGEFDGPVVEDEDLERLIGKRVEATTDVAGFQVGDRRPPQGHRL